MDVPKPSIAANQILVRVKAVTLNPTDHKHIDALSPPGSIVGCDFAGQVVEVGADVSSWKAGDRAAGFVHGGLFQDRGSFAEFLKADADLAWHVPEGISDTDAACYGISATTAALALNVRFGLPWADESSTATDEYVFIYAGGTAAGLFNIQIAKAAGYKVVTTASPRSTDLVKSYGADAVFDYASQTVAEDIVKQYPGISKAVDCFAEGKSADVCAKVVRDAGGKVLALLPGKHDMVMVYTLLGHEFQILPPIGPKFEKSPGDRAALVKFYEMLPRVLDVLKPVPITVSEGGLEEVLAGLDKLRRHQVSGGKLGVYLK